MRWTTTLLACGVIAATSYACGNGPTSPSGSGTLRLMITDSPYSEARAVLVTFSEVTAHVSSGEGGWTTIPFADSATSRTCDLKKLEGAQDVLGVGTLAAGHYTMIRLVVSSAAIYYDNALPADAPACAASVTAPEGRSASLTIPSGEVKLNRQFEIGESGATTILLDFEGDKSIVQMGNGGLRMTPVIGIISVQ